jgi:hypothetical protein
MENILSLSLNELENSGKPCYTRLPFVISVKCNTVKITAHSIALAPHSSPSIYDKENQKNKENLLKLCKPTKNAKTA